MSQSEADTKICQKKLSQSEVDTKICQKNKDKLWKRGAFFAKPLCCGDI
jgi:hypothetical protein